MSRRTASLQNRNRNRLVVLSPCLPLCRSCIPPIFHFHTLQNDDFTSSPLGPLPPSPPTDDLVMILSHTFLGKQKPARGNSSFLPQAASCFLPLSSSLVSVKKVTLLPPKASSGALLLLTERSHTEMTSPLRSVTDLFLWLLSHSTQTVY